MRRTLFAILLLPVLAIVCGCQAIRPVGMIPFADGKDWVLLDDLEYTIGDRGPTIVVPSGFVTDLTSAPAIVWAVLPPFGRYQHAAIVHDFLYWDQGCTKPQADKIFLLGMRESRVPPLKADAIWAAVSLKGTDAWEANKREKERDRLVRFVPPERLNDLDFSDTTWPQYRAKLRAENRRPASKAILAPSYCAAGD